MIDMANGIRRAFQSLFLLVALLSVFSGMCFDTLVLECDRPFYCKVKVASQTAHCDGVKRRLTGLPCLILGIFEVCFYSTVVEKLVLRDS